MVGNKLFSGFLIWRQKNISHRQFIYILSCIVGLLSGLTAVLLKNTVHFVNHFFTHTFHLSTNNSIFVILPVVGILLTFLFVKFVIKDNIGHGVSKILYAISKNNGFIKSHNTYSSIIGSTFTVGLGGSVGLEAPIVLTGSAIGSNIGRWLRLNYKTVTILIGCGAAGALAGIFKAPIAAVVFGLEVLMLDLTMWSLIPLLISAVTGAMVSYFFMGKDVIFSFSLVDNFELNQIPYFLLLGIACGFISLYFSRTTLLIETHLSKIKNQALKISLGGLGLGILIIIMPPLYGEGYNTLTALLTNQTGELMNGSIFQSVSNPVMFVVFLFMILFFKVFATAITNGSGGVGGIFAPTLFMGGIAGFLFARIINTLNITWLPEKNFALVGMAGLMAGIMHAPLTAIFLIAEITGGYSLFIPLILTSTMAFITIMYFEKHSIYHKRLAQRGELITHHKDKAILTLLKVKKIIETDLLSVKPDEPLAAMVKVISKSRRNLFPVIDNENTLVGIVLLDDIRHIIFNTELHHTVFVRDIMILPPAFINSNEHMDSVIKKFEETGAWNLPVIDHGKYIGFISKSKLFSVYRKWLLEMSDE